jgi:hypothetical protein
LDYSSIYPVVSWLVQRLAEKRQRFGEQHQQYALYLYERKSLFISQSANTNRLFQWRRSSMPLYTASTSDKTMLEPSSGGWVSQLVSAVEQLSTSDGSVEV